MNDPHLYFQKNVAIIGSRNSAVEWALRCFHAGSIVTLISRRELFDAAHVKYWLLPELKSLVKEEKIKCIFNSEVTEILPDRIVLSSGGNVICVPADFVIKAIGFESDADILKKAGIHVSSNDVPSYHSETMETNIENAYVMGTATGGTQINFKVFIENCHDHAYKILEAIGKKMEKDINVTRKDISIESPEQ